MIGVEDYPEGGEDNKVGGGRKPRNKRKRRMSDRDVVGSLRNMMIAEESRRFMTAEAEDMKVGHPVRVSRAELRTGGSCDVGMAV